MKAVLKPEMIVTRSGSLESLALNSATSKMRLKDKVILVTGSTTGIGEAIARRVVAEGGCVMFHGRDAERGQALVDGARRASRFVNADLADPARRRSDRRGRSRRSAGSTAS